MSQVRNVIYLHAHDMGRWISPYNQVWPTPHLDAFAQRSSVFKQAFCCAPTCSPSRAALLTGVTPHEAGMTGLAHFGFRLTHPEHHLAAFLQRQGMQTVLRGIQHEFEGAPPRNVYADAIHAWHPEGCQQSDEAWTQSALDFLNGTASEQPFFLSVGLFFPHRPFLSADFPNSAEKNMTPPAPLPDAPEVRRDLADYGQSVKFTDHCLGQVLNCIRATGRERDSLIILTTDHGPAFPGMKCTLSDSGIGVTLMMAFPDNPQCGSEIEALVSHMDIYPTVCDVLNLDPPEYLQGHSIKPLLEAPSASIRDEVFAEINYHGAYEPARCIRTTRYKLIWRFFRQSSSLNCDPSPCKDYLEARHEWDRPLPQIELYDLEEDPEEKSNLADRPDTRDLQQELLTRLKDWMRKTQDPLLLDGSVPMPAGARLS